MKTSALISSIMILCGSCGAPDSSKLATDHQQEIPLKRGIMQDGDTTKSAVLSYQPQTGLVSLNLGTTTYYLRNLEPKAPGIVSLKLEKATTGTVATFYNDENKLLGTLPSSPYQAANAHLLHEGTYFYGDLKTVNNFPQGFRLLRDYEVVIKFRKLLPSIPSTLGGQKVVVTKSRRISSPGRPIYRFTFRSRDDINKIIADVKKVREVEIAEPNQTYHPTPRIGASN